METQEILKLLADEVKSLEKQKIKKRCICWELDKINKLAHQQMALRKIARKIQKLTTL